MTPEIKRKGMISKMNDNAKDEIINSIAECLRDIQIFASMFNDGSADAMFFTDNIFAKLYEVGMWTRAFIEKMKGENDD